jgi:hypothetical protein
MMEGHEHVRYSKISTGASRRHDLKAPLENKGLLVRVALAGRVGKPSWVEAYAFIAMARSLLLVPPMH